MKNLQYSLAYYDRKTGLVDYYIKMPMNGVETGTQLPVFLKSAGEHGWLMCGVMDGYILPGTKSVHDQRNVTDPREVIELVFVKEM